VDIDATGYVSVCRWESCFEDIVVESSLWQQSKEWLWIITQVFLLNCDLIKKEQLKIQSFGTTGIA